MAWIEFTGATQIAQLRRTVTKKGKKTVEVVYLITSAGTVDPTTLATWVRGHWHVENKLHWVRDVTYQEDKSLVRTRPTRCPTPRRCGGLFATEIPHRICASGSNYPTRTRSRPPRDESRRGPPTNLRRRGVLRSLQLDTYHPEIGRFGVGPVLAAAERVFAADSAAALAQLSVAGAAHQHPITAASLVDLVTAFLGDQQTGLRWLIEHVDRTATPALARDHTRGWIGHTAPRWRSST